MTQKKVNAIEVKNVTKVYRSSNTETRALRNANLTIYDNEFFTLLGPSGCGKTTLLRLIAGFEDITEGSINLFDQEIVNLPPNKRPVNTVFQQYSLFPHLNVYENVAFGLKRLKKDESLVESRTFEVLELVQMKEYANRKPNQLSGGQQQRVSIARAIAGSPKLILADEPTGALDSKTSLEIMKILNDLNSKGITIVLVTHEDDIANYGSRIIKMKDGKIIEDNKNVTN